MRGSMNGDVHEDEGKRKSLQRFSRLQSSLSQSRVLYELIRISGSVTCLRLHTRQWHHQPHFYLRYLTLFLFCIERNFHSAWEKNPLFIVIIIFTPHTLLLVIHQRASPRQHPKVPFALTQSHLWSPDCCSLSYVQHVEHSA